MMKKALTTGAAAIVALMAFSAPAQAQITLEGSCQLSTVHFYYLGVLGGSDDACAGWTEGNDSQVQTQAEVFNFIETEWLFSNVGELYKEDGPEGTGEWTNSGSELDFTFGPYTNFVLALKAGSEFSLWLYRGTADAFSFNLVPGTVQGLSHFTIYGGDETTVPEPGTVFLLSTGLLGMAALRRRREDVA